MRLSVEVNGIVQGVGFRPFVHALAVELGLAGFVRNQGRGVHIEVEGEASLLMGFVAALADRAPPLSEVTEVRTRPVPDRGDTGFAILASGEGRGAARIAPDVATCSDCLEETRDPSSRRHGYAFTNCTACGPRLSVITGSPYDRASTTMERFAMCELCRREYEDPSDRRFHAEPIACPACGPALSEPIAAAGARLLAGQIVAIKSLGGYQLACDARSAEAVARLREKKQRDEKPFAVLLADAAHAALEVSLTPAERALLESKERPIVLCRRRRSSSIAELVAPGLAELGVMLPQAPLHHLLMDAVGRIPLVMTSGNRSDEPMAIGDSEAREQLGDIADAFLSHDRPIALRVDDSVLRVVAGGPVFLRRSRGHAPRAVRLPRSLAHPTLAVGGQLKNVFALGEGELALPSAHIGDLDELAAQEDFERMLDAYRRLFGIEPERVVCDLHPDYVSTRWAERFAEKSGAELLRVQHHHAHFASCLCDAGHAGRALGVSFDGVGLGRDGSAWGGEFLAGDAAKSRRVAHLALTGLPGGDRAALEPWRMAVSHLVRAGVDPESVPALRRVGSRSLLSVASLVERGVACPSTSSVGRLFDAVAALAGVGYRQGFEGGAATRLEALASAVEDEAAVYEFDIQAGAFPWVLDPAPALVAMAAETAPAAVLARRFHESLAEATAVLCERLSRELGSSPLALSGGVFVNRVFTESLVRRASARGLVPLIQRQVPPNDGGLALGQLYALASADQEGGPACA